jgi:hypothetical protein
MKDLKFVLPFTSITPGHIYNIDLRVTIIRQKKFPIYNIHNILNM